MTSTRRFATVIGVLAGLAAAVSIAVPATAAADTPSTGIPPCGLTGAYAWQDTCDPIAGPQGER